MITKENNKTFTILSMMEEDKFPTWLNGELKKRGWSQRELARRAKISSGTISNLISGMRGRGIDSLTSIAEAFEMPPEEIFRIAGVFSSAPSDTEYHEQLNHIIEHLPITEKNMLMEYAKFLLTRIK